ncbi:putative HMP/thiamine import ATP-binding protein YkoD [Clostridium ragsdalei P11]|uniref:Putative HMP/thiamine import ATP-binding protein YkoD n=1 Tax=Clostridium ragsdalei P11 TaxID=1353534 RepID=A0A1A6AL01_9CLOT|nr:ABC transporter ATP-binding protein [Clostridium ragsdalei]OBR90760.1 putative HMP/thiamine import ATP-binding protein YkoD [Clostridium ragsdalei P11]
MSTAVTVNKLTFSYSGREKKILKNVSFSVQEGESVGIVGLSGCGKSTLCLILCGAIPSRISGNLEGEVTILGKSIKNYTLSQVGTKVGIVFQNADWQLLTNRVEDEIAFPLENLCWQPEKIKTRVKEIMDKVEITHLAFRAPKQLSGGEKHLVALAAVMSMNPPIIILDEVMSNLDKKSCQRVQQILEVWKKEGKTIIVIDHQVERLRYMDNLYLMQEGRLLPAEVNMIEHYYAKLIRNFFKGAKDHDFA